jgi:hypothetical protein
MKTKLKCKFCGETMKFYDNNNGAANLNTLKCFNCGAEAWRHGTKPPYHWQEPAKKETTPQHKGVIPT